MRVMKWSVMALAVAAGTTQLAQASAQSESEGFVEGSSLNVLNRNMAMYRNSINGGTGDFNEWAHGFIADFSSGYTQGVVGFGFDAFGLVGLKLNSEGPGSGMLPAENDGDDSVSEYSKAGGAVKARFSSTELKYGEMYVATPVFDTGDTRLLPETATGFLVTSDELDGLTLNAGHFTASKDQASTDDVDFGAAAYAASGKTIDFLGGTYGITDSLSASLYASELEDVWRQYYGNLNYSYAISDDQALAVDFNVYKTKDHGSYDNDNGGADIDNTTWSLSTAYSIGAHTFTVAYQSVHGDTPFDYVGRDSIYLANSVQISDFNFPGEKSVQVRYDLDMEPYGVPGLSFMTRYLKGWDADGTDADGIYGAFVNDDGDNVAFYNGVDNGDEHEWNIEAKYVFQNGPAKDLSVRVRQAFYRADSGMNAIMGDDMSDTRLIIEYPLSIL